MYTETDLTTNGDSVVGIFLESEVFRNSGGGGGKGGGGGIEAIDGFAILKCIIVNSQNKRKYFLNHNFISLLKRGLRNIAVLRQHGGEEISFFTKEVIFQYQLMNTSNYSAKCLLYHYSETK